ncbi:MAG: beta-N-acetylhexosaminidase [Geminicoccaceae bacterium]|nr:beta-N-acetylhexosaminidase [Geminicoccaceae bacterium]
MIPPRPCVVGVSGPALSPEEAALFARLPPAGVILFARNVRDRGQLRRLVADLRTACRPWPILVMVDQEGGRVQRLRPPEWRALPPAAAIGALARRDPDRGARAAWLAGRLVACDLAEVGIDVAVAPVLDLALPETTEAIGDRAFASDPELVGRLGRAFLAGLRAGGALGVIKHLPGHGRARLDSHRTLPRVAAARAELARTDFRPFRDCAFAPLGMTAHLLYEDIDPERPATLSPRIVAEIIRGAIGFRGVLLSDDLEMGALSGPLLARARAALAAGCDLVLAASGELARNRALLEGLPPVDEVLGARLRALLDRPAPELPFDPEAGAAELAALVGRG